MEENNTEKKFRSASFSWYPGHMAKTKRHMIEDLKLIDLVVEILDARIPVASRNPDLAHYVKNKRQIIVLNKSDLADENSTNDWVKYFRNNGINAIAIEANSKKGINQLLKLINLVNTDIQKKYKQKGRIGYVTKAMIFGIPNVGKSTVINSLSGKKTAKVENRPGVTKQKQWIRIADNIQLMDTPGMLWPKFENEKIAMNLAFTNSIGQNAMDTEEVAFYLLKLLVNNYKSNVESRYNIVIADDSNLLNDNFYIVELRDNIAKNNGCIVSGGNIDETKVSNMILNDFQLGKFGRITLEKPE
ncbi:MAG: ribosome biogenesis GTPase YlqF [Clostridia bacterium]|nr:ribosome biogenesis GTPase YlqF [Clostridia bacterium]